MKKILLVTAVSLVFGVNSVAKEKNYFDNSIKLGVNIWKPKLSGSIDNSYSNTSLSDDLGYTNGDNISLIKVEVSSQFNWLPDISFEYFNYDVSKNNTLSSIKKIDNAFFSGPISTITTYQEYNTKLFGYIKNDIIKFDVGADIKSINYSQQIKENSVNNGLDSVKIAYNKSAILLPYIALTINYKNFILFQASSSITSIGDDKARDYEYSIGYKPFENLEFLAGYKYHNFETTSAKDRTEKYKTTLSGNFIGAKLIF